jgi:RimJ/RimL family protein N-acetyltransferase
MKPSMSKISNIRQPTYRVLRHEDAGMALSLEFEHTQLERFLGPLGEIVAAVENGISHVMVAIESEGSPVGFYVVHPDRRDGSCWWLGWLALDRRQQGLGFGRHALHAAVARMSRSVGCRRIRLLVAPDNSPALHLYQQAGFTDAGMLASTGELILEFVIPTATWLKGSAEFMLLWTAARSRRVFRHRRLRTTVGPYAAWIIGVERGPPARIS